MGRQRDGIETLGNLRRVGMRQHRHRGLPPRLPAVFVCCRHGGLAGIKLSMILDNLITKRHDCLVTTG
jgi:hypothetical protein